MVFIFDPEPFRSLKYSIGTMAKTIKKKILIIINSFLVSFQNERGKSEICVISMKSKCKVEDRLLILALVQMIVCFLISSYLRISSRP
jgi:hypothetical protein